MVIAFILGFVAGGVVTVVVPKVYSWFMKEVDSVETKANTVANTVSSVVSKL